MRTHGVWTYALIAAATLITNAACSSKDEEAGGGAGGAGASGASGGAGGTLGAGGSGPGGSGPGGTGSGPGGASGNAGTAAGGTQGNAGAGGDNGGTDGGGSGGTAGTGSAGTGGGGTSGAGTGGAAGAAGTAGAGGAGGQTLPPVTDYAAKGPFKTTSTPNTGPGNRYTIFRPDPLGENGFVHSPIIFGPGILTSASMYSPVLTHLASHGFVTISVNSMSGGPNAPANLQAMKDGLDWIIQQNGAAGVFQNKLAVSRAITMGYSIGATASTQLSSHQAILTTVSIHGHNTSGDPHGAVLLLTGTDDVIDDNRKTLGTLTEAPAVLMALPIGHLDVLTELAIGSSSIGASARYIAPITAWLRYWVNGDQNAKSFFWGNGCKMCSSPWITPEPNAAWKAQNL